MAGNGLQNPTICRDAGVANENGRRRRKKKRRKTIYSDT
ncbi:hypothetical protein GWI33_006959, partial [Rhynchophorus ferrugineus]